MEEYDIAVIGGGPAGMMAAIAASQNSSKVILLEKNPSLGRKLLLTGGGRCNITNLKPIKKLLNIYPQKNFLKHSFYTLTNEKLLSFFEDRGLNFIEEDNGTWRLPNIQDDVDKDKLREKALLKEFRNYVEMASKPRAKLKEVRVEAVRAGFKNCYMNKDFATIVLVAERIPQSLLEVDDILLQFYDIARTRV